MIEIKTKTVKLSEIHLNPDNPRTITEKAMGNLIKSIEDFPDMMELREIIVDDDMMVLGGNMRLLALQKIGAKNVTAKIVKGLTAEQKREFVIKDNAGFGEWDIDALATEWGELPLIDWGVDLLLNIDDARDLQKVIDRDDEENLKNQIISEKEFHQVEDLANKIIKQVQNHINHIAKTSPQELNNAIMVIINKGSGNNVIFLSDPNLQDVVNELKRYAEAGEYSPLDAFTKAIWK